MPCIKEELKRRTHEYWKVKDWGDKDESKMQWYIRELLRGELACKQYLPIAIASDPNESAKAKDECDILVIMLGHSFEPLLQAIVAYQPTQVLMVLNKKYDDEKDGEIAGFRYYQNKFEQGFDWLKENHLLIVTPEILPDPMREAGDSPVDIFRFLRQRLLMPINEHKRIVIDITGAKKSMVAGAYLFAAFADVPVSYVDFETYNSEESKPYGYTCIIEEIASPTKTFRLRDWERVRQLCDHYAFRRAGEMLNDELIPAMKEKFEGDEKELFTPDEIASAENLVNALHIYQLWDEGHFSAAYQVFERCGLTTLPLPTAIAELGANNYWPQGQTIATLQQEVNTLQFGQNKDLDTSLYLQHEKLLAYADDELAKVERLREKSEDYRSALLRAAGLSEFMILARLIRLWHADQLLLEGNNRTAIGDKKADTHLVRVIMFSQMLQILEGKEVKIRSYNLPLPTKLKLKSATGAHLMGQFWSGLNFSPDELAKLRNNAIHFCIPVSADLAEQSFDLVKANLTDFKTWATTFGLSTPNDIKTEITWRELSGAIALNFLPKK